MFNAAAVEVDITPPVGVKMAGYGARLKASQGIHDPLKAQILFLELNDSRVVMISMDLLAVQAQFSKKIHAAITEKTGVAEDHVLIACSHTHSGPQGFNLDDLILQETQYETLQEITCQKIAGACAWAEKLLQPAVISLGHSTIDGLGLNRNDPQKGAADHQVSVLRIDDTSGKPLAVLFNYGCHPTVMGADNLQISADYPGAARAMLKGLFPQTVFMFTNSAAGDVSTRFTRRSATFSEVTRMGQIMGAAVLQAMNVAEGFDPQMLKARVEPIDLPLKKFPTEAETQKLLAEAKDTLSRLQAEHASSGELRKIITKIEGIEVLLLQIKYYKGKEKLQSELQSIQIGPLHIVAVPGEPFSKTFLDIKQRIQPDQAILVGYANDYKGYFPESVPGLPGTYEDFVSPFSSQAALIIKELAIKLIKEK